MTRYGPNIKIVEFTDNGDWRLQAACRDSNPDLFFPVGTTGPALEQIAEAKRICKVCDVQGKCLKFALETNEDSGVWGGTSEEERRIIRKVWLTRARKAR